MQVVSQYNHRRPKLSLWGVEKKNLYANVQLVKRDIVT